MLLESLMHSYLDPIRWHRCGLGLPGPREYDTAQFEIFERTKMALPHDEYDKEKRNLSVSYASVDVDPEAKSTRERCIRVAAIIIVIRPGVRRICVTERRKQLRVSPHRYNKDVHR